METAIIIPTYNNEDYTVRCMKSIAENTEDYRIIWVDDGSSKESVEKVKDFIDAESICCDIILKEENTGFAVSVNLGLERALDTEAAYIVIQNNDTEVFDGWLTRMIRVAESDDIIGAVGPITSPCMSLQSVGRLKDEFEQFEDLPEYNEDPAAYATLISDHYKGRGFVTNRRLAFFSVLLKREAVVKVGLMSEEYGVGFAEDDDYMLRLRQKGYLGAIAQDVFVFHNHNTTFKGKYTPEEIDEMRRKNWDILHRKFKKGKYRPENVDLIFDIEELATLAKQLRKNVEAKDKKIEQINLMKKRQLAEKAGELAAKDKQLDEKVREISEKDRIISEKEKKLSGVTTRLEEESNARISLKADLEQTKAELDRYRKLLEKVYSSTSWKITAPIRRIGLWVKKWGSIR